MQQLRPVFLSGLPTSRLTWAARRAGSCGGGFKLAHLLLTHLKVYGMPLSSRLIEILLVRRRCAVSRLASGFGMELEIHLGVCS